MSDAVGFNDLTTDARGRVYVGSLAFRVYDVHTDDASVAPWRVFAKLGGAVPDGLAVAADGSVWVAAAHGGCVVAFESDGSERRRLAVPLPMVTSVCFG